MTQSEIYDFNNAIISITGVGRVLFIGCDSDIFVRYFLNFGFDASEHNLLEVGASALPFEDGFFQTIVLTDIPKSLTDDEVNHLLLEIYRVTKKNLLLKINLDNNQINFRDYKWWEEIVFNNNFRKNPIYYRLNSVEKLLDAKEKLFLPFEKVIRNNIVKYNFTIGKEYIKDDFLIKHGKDSDIYLVTYTYIEKYIRIGDIVLDVNCGKGSGLYLLGSLSKSQKNYGRCEYEYDVNYALEYFSYNDFFYFEKNTLEGFVSKFKKNSINVILNLGLSRGKQDFFQKYWNILTPNGRFIISLLYKDLFDQGFNIEINKYFDVEAIYIQIENGNLIELNYDFISGITDESLSEYKDKNNLFIVFLIKSPLSGVDVYYDDTVYQKEEIENAGNALAFARDYHNPWLVSGLVSIGIRTHNTKLIIKWAKLALCVLSIETADYGATLCVLSYAFLEQEKQKLHACNFYLDYIEEYVKLNHKSKNKTVLRWCVSLKFVEGLIYFKIGKIIEAKSCFVWVKNINPCEYHITLLTKTLDASYKLGFLVAGEGNIEHARLIWMEMFHVGRYLLGQYFSTIIEILPADFEVRETSKVHLLLERLYSAAKYVDQAQFRTLFFHDRINADQISININFQYQLIKQQQTITVLQEGKDWLEAQWFSLQEQLKNKDAELKIVQESKNWLERQWLSLQEQLKNKDAELKVVQEGKDWLEAQWLSQQEQLKNRDAELKVVQEGKDWLEAQWLLLKEMQDKKY